MSKIFELSATRNVQELCLEMKLVAAEHCRISISFLKNGLCRYSETKVVLV